MRSAHDKSDRDGAGAVVAVAASAAMIAQQVAGKAVRDALFLSHHPASRLPAMVVGAAFRFASVDAGVADAALLGVVVPIDLGLQFIHPDRSTRDGEAWVVDRRVADALVWRRPRAAARTSDWILRSFMLTHVAGPSIGTASFDRDAGAGTLVGVEALAMTQLVTGLVKHVVRRERPGGEAQHGERAWASFPSGRTSVSFSGATMLTIYAHEYGWGGDHQWAIPVAAYSLAGFTGYLRMAGRRHWLTDVLTGALVGSGTAYLTYAVRTAQ